jgi:DNA-damage-inducible protein J
MKTQTTIRVEETSYHQAKEILSQMGLNYSQAISVFNNMIVLNKGLPFELKIPNNDTKQALDELETKKGKSFKNVDELFDDLDSYQNLNPSTCKYTAKL